MADSANVETIKRFYNINDGRIEGDRAALFNEDVVVFNPIFGVAHGLAGMAAGRKGRARFKSMHHHVDEFDIVEVGDRVFVEGTTGGETVEGRIWDGRKDRAGHFCAVFDFKDGRISRMYVYFDPNFEE